MSDCSTRAWVTEYDQQQPIRGRLVYVDGTGSAFTFSRLVNGAVRVVDHIEVDGVRYTRLPERDWDSEVCE